MRTRFAVRLVLLATLAALAGCVDEPTTPDTAALQATVNDGLEPASATWNVRGLAQLAALPNGSHAPASRILTYLSLAQYRSVLAAEDAKHGTSKPSVRAAVGAASVIVLSSFFPASAAGFEAQFDADMASEDSEQEDQGTGEEIGRAVGVEVLALAASDGFNTVSPGVPPVGPGYWVSSSAPIVRSLYGVRPFFMTSGDQLRSPPPPAFGSPEYLAALAEVRAISDTRTAEQLAIAQRQNSVTPPFTPGAGDVRAVALIRKYPRSERQAARILATVSMAAFDAQIACFDTKFAYWFIRPSQADPAITLPIGLPNHPSYPSAHSCITSAMNTVLIRYFPQERSELEAITVEAGQSRKYGGIHYQFDIEAGQTIGRAAAQLALHGNDIDSED